MRDFFLDLGLNSMRSLIDLFFFLMNYKAVQFISIKN